LRFGTIGAQQLDYALYFLAHETERAARGARRLRGFGDQLIESVTRSVDGKALVIEQLANAPDEEHLVVLIITPVAAALDRF
jgi:hypothetical protein